MIIKLKHKGDYFMKVPYKIFQEIDTLIEDAPDVPMTLKANILSQCDNLTYDKEISNDIIDVDEKKLEELLQTMRKTTDIKFFVLMSQIKKEIPTCNS